MAPARPDRRLLVVVTLAAATVGAGCGSTRAPVATAPPSTPPTAGTRPTTAPITAGGTPTTVAVPVAPQPTASTAGAALVSGWASGNRPVALSVATPRAVATLFAVAYPPGLAVSRGCSAAFPPIVCTYGPPGGGPVGARVFELYEVHTPKGWYVGSVVIQS